MKMIRVLLAVFALVLCGQPASAQFVPNWVSIDQSASNIEPLIDPITGNQYAWRLNVKVNFSSNFVPGKYLTCAVWDGGTESYRALAVWPGQTTSVTVSANTAANYWFYLVFTDTDPLWEYSMQGFFPLSVRARMHAPQGDVISTSYGQIAFPAP